MQYDIICFSHLRWNFVFQRPQHLLTRFSLAGHRVFYIEEPIYDAPAAPYYDTYTDKDSGVRVMTMHLGEHLVSDANMYQRSLTETFMMENDIDRYITWYYAPMAFAHTRDLPAIATVYDCMDELSAFRFAPPQLKSNEQSLMAAADLVFTGGISLYESKKHFHHNIHAFPSSIDKHHFGKARSITEDPQDQAQIPHPRLGFFGVIDERFDIEMLEAMATLRPAYQFILVGPVVKIDPASLPKKNNIHYLGGKSYNELPAYLSGWDVAMMPFALNESTAFISPTKTPEFLAGGKPVISTPVNDVVHPYADRNLVRIAATAEHFMEEADVLLNAGNDTLWLERVDEYLSNLSWDNTWGKMAALLNSSIEKNISSNSKNTHHV